MIRSDFYRAMHMRVRELSCAKTNKDIFEIFSPSGSQAILVFPHQSGWRCSHGKGGYEKMTIFDQYLALG